MDAERNCTSLTRERIEKTVSDVIDEHSADQALALIEMDGREVPELSDMLTDAIFALVNRETDGIDAGEVAARTLESLARDLGAIEGAAREGMNNGGGPYPWNAAAGVRDLLLARAAEHRD